MNKNPFDMRPIPGQQKAIDATNAAGRVAAESAQAIAQINQQAAQELAAMIQKRVAELMQTQDLRSSFEYVHAEVLQDAAKEVMQYQNQLLQVLKSGNKELSQIAEVLIQESKADLIHFVNDATNNAPTGSEAYISVFKTSFNNALQNFELLRASMADSFANFEKSVENVSNFSDSKGSASRAYFFAIAACH